MFRHNELYSWLKSFAVMRSLIDNHLRCDRYKWIVREKLLPSPDSCYRTFVRPLDRLFKFYCFSRVTIWYIQYINTFSMIFKYYFLHHVGVYQFTWYKIYINLWFIIYAIFIKNYKNYEFMTNTVNNCMCWIVVLFIWIILFNYL